MSLDVVDAAARDAVLCPTNVFEERGNDPPLIARQEDCQTCFQCEVYCPFEAMFVAPRSHPAPADSEWRNEAKLIETGQLGLYRRRVGWSREKESPRSRATPSGARSSVACSAACKARADTDGTLTTSIEAESVGPGTLALTEHA